MPHIKILFLSAIFAFFCFLLSGCGAWLPAQKMSINQIYPLETVIQTVETAPIGSYRTNLFHAPYIKVFNAVEKSVKQANLVIETTSKEMGIILASQRRLLSPPLDLLNCPNNHFANQKPQKWTYSIAIVIAEKKNGTTLVKAVAKTQGRCFKGGGCYGYDPCPQYSSVHWALGYESDDKQLSQLMISIGNTLSNQE